MIVFILVMPAGLFFLLATRNRSTATGRRSSGPVENITVDGRVY